MADKVLIEQAADVGIVRLNDPATLNAISPALVEELERAFDECALTSRAIILTTSGANFSSGGNLAGGALPTGEDGQTDVGLVLESHVNPLMVKLAALPIPWISAVRGAAAGVGCSLALAADLVVASDNAYFLQAFARVGLVPDGGSSWLLARAIGRARATEMMLLGEKVGAAQALEWGMINRVVPDHELDARAQELATRLAAGPTQVLGMIRKLAWVGAQASFAETLAAERVGQCDAGRTQDFQEGLQAFTSKRAPRFSGK